MPRRLWKWIDERWPIARVARAVVVEDIPGGSSYWYTFGSSVLFVFILQATTGILELFFYVPTVDHAYLSLSFLRTQVPFGWLMHNLHYWGASAMVVLIIVHVTVNYVWAAYKNPRQLTWLLGAGLFLLVLAMMFTGSPLPWDEKGYWATEVGTSIAGMTPLAGGLAKRLLRGGEAMGQLTLSRFFILHIILLSGLLATLILIHLVSFRKGGTSGPWSEGKRLRMGPFWPDQVWKDLVVACVVFVALIGLSVFLPPAYTGAADPMDALYTPKPEWPFLFLYQALKLVPGSLEASVALGLPLILVIIVLAVPFVDRRPERNPARRPLALGLYFAGLAAIVALGVAGALSHPGAGQAQPPGETASAGGAAPAGGAEPLAPRLIGNARHGGLIYAQVCEVCHGEGGRRGVPNPGSKDGAIPSLVPIDGELFARDPEVFASKIDPFLQHGSKPEGPSPAMDMPGFGDTNALTQPQIAHLEAYVLRLNGVRRAEVMRPGARPALVFVLIAAVFGGSAAGLGALRLGLRRRGASRRPAG